MRTQKFCTCCLRSNRVEVKECSCGFKFPAPPSPKTMRKAQARRVTSVSVVKGGAA